MTEYKPLTEITNKEIERSLKAIESHKDTNKRDDDRSLMDILISGADKMYERNKKNNKKG